MHSNKTATNRGYGRRSWTLLGREAALIYRIRLIEIVVGFNFMFYTFPIPCQYNTIFLQILQIVIKKSSVFFAFGKGYGLLEPGTTPMRTYATYGGASPTWRTLQTTPAYDSKRPRINRSVSLSSKCHIPATWMIRKYKYFVLSSKTSINESKKVSAPWLRNGPINGIAVKTTFKLISQSYFLVFDSHRANFRLIVRKKAASA